MSFGFNGVFEKKEVLNAERKDNLYFLSGCEAKSVIFRLIKL